MPTKSIPSLQCLCMDQYLIFLESSCYSFIQLSMIDSPLLRKTTDNILPCLKNHLETQLPGAIGGILRGEMLEKIFKEYPSRRAKKTYQESTDNDALASNQEAAFRAMEIQNAGKKCSSLGCTGFYVMETMACVVVNDQLKELVFDFSAEKRIWERNRPLKHYVNCDFPSILTHYIASVAKYKGKRTPALTRLIINGTNLKTQEYAGRVDGSLALLNSTDATREYLDYPALLSTAIEKDFNHRFIDFSPKLPLADCLMGAVVDLFDNFGLDSFEKLTEIQFGTELSRKALRSQSRAITLFHGIGICCPNLKILDISNALNIATETFLQMFFRHPHICLHKYSYNDPWEEDANDFNTIKVKKDPDSHEFLKHSWDRYCPFCMDPLAGNGLRFGANIERFTPLPVVDDRLYDIIEQKYPEKAGQYLVNVVRASDLVKSVSDPIYQLVRPDFVEEEFQHLKIADGDPSHPVSSTWFRMKENEAFSYEPDEYEDVLHKLCNSLQVLKLAHLGPRYEIVPFLLTALPNIKSLGSVNVLNGLRMFKDITGDDVDGLGAQLEELTLDIVNMESGPNKLTVSSWAHTDIRQDIYQFYDSLDPATMSIQDRRKRLSEDLDMVTRACPNLRALSLFFFSIDIPGLLGPGETWIWEPVRRLEQLDNVTIIGHDWDEVSTLFTVIGDKLARLCLSLDSRTLDVTTTVPALDTLLQLCPNLHTLKLDFRMVPISINDIPPTLDLSRLKKVSLGLLLSRKAFTWLCRHAVNLEEILVPSVSSQRVQQHPVFGGDQDSFQEYFTKDDLAQLMKANPMKKMKKFNVHLCLTDIPAAMFLVETLRHNAREVEDIGKLTIRVELPGGNNNMVDHEPLLQDMTTLMSQMRKFKLFCERLGDGGHMTSGQGTRMTSRYGAHGQVTRVKWEWQKVGLLQNFAEIEQLNAIVEPMDVE